MKAFVTFIRTLFNSQATLAGGRASQPRFSSLVRWQGLARALLTLLAALLLGTGLSVLQACNSQPQPAAQPEVRTSVQAPGQTTGQAADRAARQASERAQDRASERASDRASGGVADWTRDRAPERSNDRNPDRASGKASDRASDRSSDRASRQGGDGLGTVAVGDLPAEARQTLALIREGGPYPYEKDGTVFGNYERKLPRQRRGYYTEYTVKTPRVRSRGARRIIAGGRDGRPTEFYYTDDHYQTFRRIEFP
ncbi:Guanyl-specific ribonuclease St [Lautropia mirabilis]|jgi:ribonuclease|uniref:Ribonuclease n=1 Tax=Lautropia mirabilis ATCC 51599 TaxID=887898 RepID=E7RUP8_9BURK|nr:ribonuclease [Lautropia mirabilis ATCC 51599]VEH03639.1 Guanyl-specific ribonuclease St [Lautropia mirabilis]